MRIPESAPFIQAQPLKHFLLSVVLADVAYDACEIADETPGFPWYRRVEIAMGWLLSTSAPPTTLSLSYIF